MDEFSAQLAPLKWHQTDLAGACRWMHRKCGLPETRVLQPPQVDFNYPPLKEDSETDSVLFDDGSICMVESVQGKPYSDQTPDLDTQPPIFWIGEPSLSRWCKAKTTK